MARTDYGAILSTVIKDTSDAVREVNGTSSLIAPNQWGMAIRTMHSDSDYENALEQMIEETASGDIASFSDGANDIPLKSLTCTINPVQDLHGQDYPYPSGGGKNKLNAPDITISQSSYVLNNVGCFLPSGNYVLSFDFSRTSGADRTSTFRIDDNNGNAIFTTPITIANGRNEVPINLSQDGYYLKCYSNAIGTYSKFQIESGSSATPYAPYSNICPITGHTELNLVHTGKNLLKPVALSDPDLEFNVNYRFKRNVIPNARCTMSFTDKDTTVDMSGISFGFVDSNWDSTQSLNVNEFRWVISNGVVQSVTKNIPSSGDESVCLTGIIAYPRTDATWTKIWSRYNIQIELGSSATTYEPYTGTTTTTDFGTTVYGGTLDVTTGVLTIDRAIINLGDINWNTRGSGNSRFFYTELTNYKYLTDNERCLCECYVRADIGGSTTNTGWLITNPSVLRIRDNSYADASAFKIGMSGMHFVYPLATPTTTQLTPQEVKSLLGSNNIYHDCNGQVAVTYRANGQLYVEQHS